MGAPSGAASLPAARSAAPGPASSRAEAVSRSRRLKVMAVLPAVTEEKIHPLSGKGRVRGAKVGSFAPRRGHNSRRDARLPAVSVTQRSLTLKMAGPTELVLERADGSQRSIHPLWLRERCRDPASIDLETPPRLRDRSEFELGVEQ